MTPEADAFVRDGPSADENFGAEEELRVKDANTEEYDRRAYIRFDLHDIQGSVRQAVLRLWAKNLPNGTSVTFKVFAADDEWKEDSITWQHQPAQGQLLRTGEISAPGEVQIDLTDFVNEQITGDKYVTVMLLDDTGGRRMLTLWSREGRDPPVLQLTMAAH